MHKEKELVALFKQIKTLGSSLHGILQARILNWVAIPFPRGSSRPRDQTQVSSIADRFFTLMHIKETWYIKERESLLEVKSTMDSLLNVFR